MSRIKQLLSVLLLVAFASFAQSPTPGTNSPVNAYQSAFNSAYYQSKAPAFQPLYNGRPGSAQPNAATISQAAAWTLVSQLIAQGYTVDELVDGQGVDPYTAMLMRQINGDVWVPAGAGAAMCLSISQPGCVTTVYTAPAPAGSIPVCTLLSCYPPFPVPPTNTPVTPPTPLAANPVGVRIIPQLSPGAPSFVGDIFSCAVANDGYGLGATWTGTSGTFSGTWTKQALEMGLMTVWVKTQ